MLILYFLMPKTIEFCQKINFLIKQHLMIAVDFPFLAKIDGSLFRGCDEWNDFIEQLQHNMQNLAKLEPEQIEQAQFLSELIVQQFKTLLYVAKLQQKSINKSKKEYKISPQMVQAKEKRSEILKKGDYQALQEYYKIQHELNSKINQLEQQFINGFYADDKIQELINHTKSRLDICRKHIDLLESKLN